FSRGLSLRWGMVRTVACVDGSANRVEQILLFERLAQISDPARLGDALACRGIVIGADEDDRNRRPARRQLRLKLEAGCCSELDVQDQTRGAAQRGGAQKLLGRRKQLGRIAAGPKQSSK